MQLRFYICFSVNFNEGANVTMVNSNIGGVSVQVEAPAPKGNLFIFFRTQNTNIPFVSMQYEGDKNMGQVWI